MENIYSNGGHVDKEGGSCKYKTIFLKNIFQWNFAGDVIWDGVFYIKALA